MISAPGSYKATLSERFGVTDLAQLLEAASTATSGTATNTTSAWDRVEASNRLREVRREIDRREARVASLESERDQKIAILKNKKCYANNNLAGAIWEESISSEMQVITDQYQSKIDAEHRKLDRLQQQADQQAGSL